MYAHVSTCIYPMWVDPLVAPRLGVLSVLGIVVCSVTHMAVVWHVIGVGGTCGGTEATF